MRVGLMVGPERGRYATKVDRLRADARWAEDVGLSTVWIPQIPDEFVDACTLTGPPSVVASEVVRLARSGISQVMIYPLAVEGGPETTVERFQREVMPLVRRELHG